MRLLNSFILLSAVLCVADCNSGTYAVITLSAPGLGTMVTSVQLQVALDGKTSSTTPTLRESGGGPISFPTDTVLSIPNGSGVLTVNATALGAGGTPVGTGSASGTLSHGHTLNLALTLTTQLQSGALMADKTTADFGSVTSGNSSTPATVTITNTGGDVTGALTTALGGANSAMFTIDTDGCNGMTLAAGASCDITLHYAPSAVGSHAASLTVSAAPGGLATVSLTGTAVGAGGAALAFDSTGHSFGSANTGTTSSPVTFTLSNSGTQTSGAVTSSPSGNTADFMVTDNCNGKTLGASCTYVVAFTPQTAGTKSLTVTAAATPGGSASFTVTGTASMPAVPILHWALDGNGNNTGSLSGFNLSIPTSSVTFVPGHISGMAMQVNAGAFSTVTGMRAVFSASPTYTISMWIYPSTNPQTANAFFGNFQNTTAPYGGLEAYFQSYQSFSMCAASTTNTNLPSGTCSTTATGPTINANTWHHIMWRYAGTSTSAGGGANLDFYVDDVKVATVQNDANKNPIFNMGVTDTLYMMAAYNVTYDDIRIYDKVYSDAQQCTDIIGGTWTGTACTLP